MSFKNNDDYPWSSYLVWAPMIVFGVFLLAFVFVETKVSKEPVMPLRILLARSPICEYSIEWFVMMIHLGLPLYVRSYIYLQFSGVDVQFFSIILLPVILFY